MEDLHSVTAKIFQNPSGTGFHNLTFQTLATDETPILPALILD